MKAIFKKELRDLLPWIVVGMILIAALCWYGKVKKSSELAEILPIGFAVVALGFGFLQTLGDMRTEAKGYLLHRPINIGSVFWGKLLAGAVGYTAAIAVPMIGLAIYQKLMGPEKLPLSPMDSIPSLLMGIVAFSFHPAAMWAVSRQARWVGTKAVPLAVPLLGCVFSYMILFAYTNQAYLSLCWAGFVLVVLATLVSVIAAASHAFCESQFLPPNQSGRPFIRFENLGILTVSVVAVSFVTISLLAYLFPNANYPYTHHDLALSNDGQLWDFAQTTLSEEEYYNPEISVRKISADPLAPPVDLQPRPADWSERIKAGLSAYKSHRQVWRLDFQYLRQFQFSSQNYWDIRKHNNRLLAYSRGLQAVLTPSGFYDSVDDAQGAFVDPSFASNAGRLSDRNSRNGGVGIGDSLIYDRNGVYQVDWKARTLRTILDQPNEAVALVIPTSDQDPVFWVWSGSSVTRYLIEPLNDDDSLELADSELIERVRTLRFPDIKTTKTDQWSFAPDADGKSLSVGDGNGVTVAETDDGTTLFYKLDYPNAVLNYQLRGEDDSINRSGEVKFPVRAEPDVTAAGVFLPPAFSAAMITAMMSFGAEEGILILAGYSLIHGLSVVAFVFWLSRYYELTPFSRNLWLLVAITFGLAAPLAIWIIYPRLVRERCHHCEAMRRIDRARCHQCGADWARLPVDGNEIIGIAPAVPAAASV